MDGKPLAEIKELSQCLMRNKNVPLTMLVGVDGFVDEIIHVVDKRYDLNTFKRLEKIEDFGTRIIKAAGYSTNIEFVPVQAKLGGNGPILSNALLEYGADLSYVGCIGSPEIHPVFKDMAGKCKNVYSMANPGNSDAVEFEDGKLILGKHASLKEVTWERFKEVMGGVSAVASVVGECDLFGLENWVMMPYMNEIWEGLIEEVFPLLPDKAVKPIAFFDLADPEKRTNEDILYAMKLIGKFEKKFRTILGLNEKELYEIAEVFNVEEEGEERLKHLSVKVYEKLGIHCLVVHPTKEAMCVLDGDYYHTTGPYCEKPVLTTGAGDNFNAGFCFGCALGIDPQSALTLGVATSGFYVRNAKSPTIDDALSFLDNWINGKV